jgi:hypothetical protein
VIIAFAAYDSTNAPLAGLTPTWLATFDAESGDPASEPAISEVGGGAYKFEYPTDVDDFCGIIDLGASATPRYLLAAAYGSASFMATDADGAPLTGLSPTWSLLKDVETDEDVDEPVITELGDGIYKFERPSNAFGIVDLGASATPRYLSFSSAEDDVAPVAVSGVTPADSTQISRNTVIEFDLDASQPYALFMLLVSSRDSSVCDVAYDSFNGFRGKYRTPQSTTDGSHFTVARVGGWTFRPKFEFVPVLASGNMGAIGA